MPAVFAFESLNVRTRDKVFTEKLMLAQATICH
jgi:hypothetical protein